ncbi:MAG TPA: hypothetical protein EYO83_10450 [Gemmatimonadetes bacterium]|nr:hypothetical protein [Gemmatimonadota bacterium]
MARPRRKPSMTPGEALEFHQGALVVDSKMIVSLGVLYTDKMREAMAEWVAEGRLSRTEIQDRLLAMELQELQNSPEARSQYLEFWDKTGVTVGSSTYAGPHPPDGAFETAVRSLTQGRAMVDAMGGDVRLVLTADDLEQVYKDRVHGVIFDFQDTTHIGGDLSRLDVFHDMGLRIVQLTYNLRNLVGDGCTERYKTGLTYFGIEVVERLNELNMMVDVSHCSQQVGWDAIEHSTSPVIVTHSASNGVAYHDRGKNDDLAKAIADQGGYFGVAAIAGFLRNDTNATLDDFVDHVEHLVNVMGIDHVGIGSDKCGFGPGTETMFEFPPEMGPFSKSHMYKENADPRSKPAGFDWSGFRPEHRLSDQHRMPDFDQPTDWSNITVKLAERGFNDDELRKLLGLNFLRVFRDVVG